MPENESIDEKAKRLSTEIGDPIIADVILFSGGIDNESADYLIKIVKTSERRENAILMLTTRGGSPDAAYRIARCLQKYYTKLVLYIYGRCKSAGTLVSIVADELILSDYGEFGPLDIQLDKKDELFENTSGLDITQALSSLNVRTFNFFRDVLLDLRNGSRGQISTRLASQIATDLSIGVYENIYAQIDPSQLGSIERGINIALDYGNRLKSSNVKDKTLDRLVSGYSSHSFVIDINEAKQLFYNVREPTKLEEELGECIYFLTRDEVDKPLIMKLNQLEQKDERTTPENTERGEASTRERSGEDNQATVGKEQGQEQQRDDSQKAA